MAQNDTHVALIILTTQKCGGGGLLAEKTFSGQILCFCAFGANIRSYTKQRARHGTPFLHPPPLLRRASMSPPPPPPRRAIFRSPCHVCVVTGPSLGGFAVLRFSGVAGTRWPALVGVLRLLLVCLPWVCGGKACGGSPAWAAGCQAKPTRLKWTLYTCLQEPSACTAGRCRGQRVGDGAGEGRQQRNTLNPVGDFRGRLL